MTDLAPASVWTPARESDRHLTRVVLGVDNDRHGESVRYMHDEGDFIMTCSGPTFRQWVGKMRCTRSISRELEEILCEARES